MPAIGATGVSTTTTIVFTFSEAMEPYATSGLVYDNAVPIPNFYTTTDSWNAGNTVLTCTPDSAFLANTTVSWVVSGQNPGGQSAWGTSAWLIQHWARRPNWHQYAYDLLRWQGPSLQSNFRRCADPGPNYSLRIQRRDGAEVESHRNDCGVNPADRRRLNLTHLPPPSADVFIMSPFYTSLSSFDAAYPAGDYSFDLQGSPNQTVTVTLPPAASQPQPGPPRVTNYVAAQTVDPSQPFVLAWDAFPGGTANDYIDVDVGSDLPPNPGFPGALTGADTTFTIPAGTSTEHNLLLAHRFLPVRGLYQLGIRHRGLSRDLHGVQSDHRAGIHRDLDPDQCRVQRRDVQF